MIMTEASRNNEVGIRSGEMEHQYQNAYGGLKPATNPPLAFFGAADVGKAPSRICRHSHV
jgi:hypothetical protein